MSRLPHTSLGEGAYSHYTYIPVAEWLGTPGHVSVRPNQRRSLRGEAFTKTGSQIFEVGIVYLKNLVHLARKKEVRRQLSERHTMGCEWAFSTGSGESKNQSPNCLSRREWCSLFRPLRAPGLMTC